MSNRRQEQVCDKTKNPKTLGEAPTRWDTGPALGMTLIVVTFYLRPARLVPVYGAEALSLFLISQITAAKNPLTGRVAEVRLLQKL